MVEGISHLWFYTNENQKKVGFDASCGYNRVNLFYSSDAVGAVGNIVVTGHATVAAVVVSIEFSAQLLLVDSPLPMFSCFISCSVLVARTF
jgi:hypothetical protein